MRCRRPWPGRSGRRRRRSCRRSAPLPAAGIEETEQIAAWLEQPGVRLMEITGDWVWPLHAVLDHDALVHHALGGA